MKTYTSLANALTVAAMVAVVFGPGLMLGCKTLWGLYKGNADLDKTTL